MSKHLTAWRRSSVQKTVIATLLLVIFSNSVLLALSSIGHIPFPFALSLFCTMCFLVSGILKIFLVFRPGSGPRNSQ